MARSNLAVVREVAKADPFEELLVRYSTAKREYERLNAADDVLMARAKKALIAAGFKDGKKTRFRFGTWFEASTVVGAKFSYYGQDEYAGHRKPYVEMWGENSDTVRNLDKRFADYLARVEKEDERYKDVERKAGYTGKSTEDCECAYGVVCDIEDKIEQTPGNTLLASYAKLLVLFDCRVRSALNADGTFDEELSDGMRTVELKSLHNAINILAEAIGQPPVALPPIYKGE
jgi:hypothetical protein